MQLILPIDLVEKPVEDFAKSFCWRKDLIGSHESLWSLIHKFAYLNAVKGVDIRSVFRRNSNERIYDDNWTFRNRSDLRYFAGLDQIKLAKVFQVDEKTINTSVLTTFLRQNEISSFSSENLRFCRECLESGFHSSLYQMLFFSKCPLHQTDLTDKCPNCKNVTPYKLNNSSIKKAYACFECQTFFCPSLAQIGYKLPSEEKRDKTLMMLGEWLIRRAESKMMDSPVNIWINNHSVNEKANHLVSNIIANWVTVLEPQPDVKAVLIEQVPDNSTSHIKISVKSQEAPKPNNNPLNKDWERGLYAIYKSISRHLIKTQLSQHIHCIKDCGQNLWWTKDALSCDGKICAAANAFLLWRMFYEDLRHPINLFKKYKRRESDRPCIEWTSPGYRFPDSILRRIFALECYWVYYECKRLTETFSKKNIYSFNTIQITKSFIPYWIVEPNKQVGRGNFYDFHYWYNESDLQSLHKNLEDYRLQQVTRDDRTFS